MNILGETKHTSKWIPCNKVSRIDSNGRPLFSTASEPISLSCESRSNFLKKPTATVIPTTFIEGSYNSSMNLIYASKMIDECVQTDDIGVDMDLLFHIEDMLRTQRSLTPIKLGLSTNCILSSKLDTSNSGSLNNTSEELSIREALEVQKKVNADLKRLLISALDGNVDLAEKLIGLTNDNVNLSDQSKGLKFQKTALMEATNAAEIAADVWRAKCLASRVVASEAAKQAANATRQIHLTQHSLAHLLGERTKIRRYLGLAVAMLSSSPMINQIEHSFNIPQIVDTIGLAGLCYQLSSIYNTSSDVHPISCNADTVGEQLAQYVLTNETPDPANTMDDRRDPIAAENRKPSAISVLATIPPFPSCSENDLVQQVLNSFQSTKSGSLNDLQFPPCANCKGRLMSI